MKTGIELIAIERQEQIEKHGRTTELDVKNNDLMQLLAGAHSLMIDINSHKKEQEIIDLRKPIGWDVEIWRKMNRKSYKERLIIAGALIAAEIDRIQFENESETNLEIQAINKLKLEVKILQELTNSDVAERIASYEKAINVLEHHDDIENTHELQTLKEAIVESMVDISFKSILESYDEISDMYEKGTITPNDFYGIIEKFVKRLH